MQPHARAVLAACAYAAVTGGKAAGVYDHAASVHLRVAAERRGDRLQARDGESGASYDGTLPELLDGRGRPFASLAVDGAGARGVERASGAYYDATVSGELVQLFDHAAGAWFACTVQPD